jgi:hypothetical protein
MGVEAMLVSDAGNSVLRRSASSVSPSAAAVLRRKSLS